jgi:dTDP-4-dehydrorhamnose reductase
MTVVNLVDAGAVERALEEADPEAILHAAAISSAEAVLRDPARAREINIGATTRLASWCESRGRRLVYTSTDLVFDGTRSWYREDDAAMPVLEYGRTKHDAEAPVLSSDHGLIARLPLLYGPNPSGRPGFFDQAIESLRRGEPRAFFRDEFRTPLDYRTAALALLRLVEARASGIIHVAGAERVSRFELMRRAAVAMGIDPGFVRPGSQADVSLSEPRPADVSLDTSKLARLLPDLERPSIEAALVDTHP